MIKTSLLRHPLSYVHHRLVQYSCHLGMRTLLTTNSYPIPFDEIVVKKVYTEPLEGIDYISRKTDRLPSVLHAGTLSTILFLVLLVGLLTDYPVCCVFRGWVSPTRLSMG